ncbi:MAG: cation-transporting P-type ATPase [Phaeodactylibacter sp.]|nr:cation-transporting P-type ATPase [Phaeodactylibacter sp.]
MAKNEQRSSKHISSPHARESEELLQELDTNAEQGLSQEEAEKRLEEYGPNELEEQEQKSLLALLISQVNNPVIYLLTAACALAFAFGDTPEAIAIIVVIVLNTAIGFWMEFQARQSLKALKKMDIIKAQVVRDGEEREINAEHLAPGDILLLKTGALAPADGRILSESELSVDESPLTGESVPVDKDTKPLGEDTQVADRKNMVFKGTAITNGSARVVVTATGMQTEIGNISAMVSSAEDEQAPLDKKLQRLSRRLIWATLGLAALFFLFGWMAGKSIYQLVQTAIAWTIAAIPEGLPIVASIALAKGMLRLAKRNVIVKRLSAVETLGEATVIFTDKTGTLTENRLTLDTLQLEGARIRADWKEDGAKAGLSAQGNDTPPGKEDKRLRSFFRIATLCNDALLAEERNEEEAEEGKGDPLDQALLHFCKAYDEEWYEKLRGLERLAEEPFDSEDMVMGTVSKVEDSIFLSGKGAPQAMLDRCSRVLTPDGVKKLDEESRENWINYNEELSEAGLRVIAFAYKELSEKPSEEADVEEKLMQDMVLVGLAGFIDPPRKEVREAVELCQQAGIKVEMVTGDHPGTARNIGAQVAIVEDKQARAIHGSELREIEKDRPQEAVDTAIFARVDPEQKLNLVKLYQENGEVVGMTGDGVNDAPALKKSDIGIAMGKRGTQVATEVADLVLKDDSFPSIVEAIREGRIIFGNIRKFIVYQLSYHLSEILLIALVSFTVFELPLLPLQLLFLNLLSDVFPALALGIGRGSENVMLQKPKDPEEAILTREHWIRIGAYGLILTLALVGAYFFAREYWGMSPEACNNVAFFSLAFAQLWHVFDMREADEPIFNNQVTRNKFIWGALILCTAVIVAAYFIPTLKTALSFQALSARVWGLIAVTSVLPLLVIQLLKVLTKGRAFQF